MYSISSTPDVPNEMNKFFVSHALDNCIEIYDIVIDENVLSKINQAKATRGLVVVSLGSRSSVGLGADCQDENSVRAD